MNKCMSSFGERFAIGQEQGFSARCIRQRWYSLRLKLAFQLVKEAPVGVFGQDLLRA